MYVGVRPGFHHFREDANETPAERGCILSQRVVPKLGGHKLDFPALRAQSVARGMGDLARSCCRPLLGNDGVQTRIEAAGRYRPNLGTRQETALHLLWGRSGQAGLSSPSGA